MKRIMIFIFCFFGSIAFSEEALEEDSKNANNQILDLQKQLINKFEEVQQLSNSQASDEEYERLLFEIKEIKQTIKNSENKFRENQIDESLKTEEGYAFWDQGETTLSQLIMEYGSMDYLYVIPHELGVMKINLFSTIAIPRVCWSEIIELILSQNGIGIKKLNPFLRQLYIIKHDPANIEAIASSPEDLNFISDGASMCYIFSPKVEQIRTVQSFLERFSDIKQSSVHIVGTNVVVMASKETIQRLLSLYTAIFEESKGKIVKVVSLSKIDPIEAEKILKTFFMEPQPKTRPSFYQSIPEELSVVTQGTAIVLVGDAKIIEKAEKVLMDLERQLDDPSEMTIFWYTCKHSNPEEIATVLDQVYFSLSSAKTDDRNKAISNAMSSVNRRTPQKQPASSSGNNEKKNLNNNFIVDPKTGSLLMVIRKEDLSKIKSLLKKLDVPKKMAQIDVLLVERKLHDRKQTGINLLKIGSAKNVNETSFNFDASSSSKRKGLLDFILSRANKKLPSFDLALSFLMAQDDMQISASPSILGVNQTPATIYIVDEISINNGVVQLEDAKGPKTEKSFTRSNYGITITMTPTIHLSDEEDENAKGFITLQTDITFETTGSSSNDRPPVTKRHIENEVRIADGETIILGGLRRKSQEKETEKIPFLGDLPGIGKLFGTTKLADSSSEMFIFITPHIIKDPIKDLQKNRNTLLEKRVGDIPEFLEKLEIAKQSEKKKMFENSLKLIFD